MRLWKQQDISNEARRLLSLLPFCHFAVISNLLISNHQFYSSFNIDPSISLYILCTIKSQSYKEPHEYPCAAQSHPTSPHLTSPHLIGSDLPTSPSCLKHTCATRQTCPQARRDKTYTNNKACLASAPAGALTKIYHQLVRLTHTHKRAGCVVEELETCLSASPTKCTPPLAAPPECQVPIARTGRK